MEMNRNYFKLTAAAGFFVFVLFFLANCSSKESAENNKLGESAVSVIVVTDQAGLGDNGFNDSGWAGVQRAVKDFAVKGNFIQSNEQADYIPNLSIAAGKADIVVAMGFLMIDALKKVAPKFPDTKFIFIDGRVEGANIASFDFKGEEASFLAGFLAAGVSRSGKLGIVKGMDIPPVLALEYGFRGGVKAAEEYLNRNITVYDMTVGDFNDPVKGKSLARNLISRGCDVIIQIAGNSGLGVIELFKKTERPGLLISSDMDIEDEIPGRVLTCVMKRFDNAVYNAIKAVIEDKFEAGYYNIGLREEAVGITDMRHTRKLLEPRVLKKTDELKNSIMEGRITPPNNKNRYEKADYRSYIK